jgi:CrcB protein
MLYQTFMTTPLFIFLGAGLGGLSRWWIGSYVQSFTASAFPVGTLAVNASGCLAIGILAALSVSWLQREDVRLGLIVGVLGGYTTFSSFALESLKMMNDGHWGRAALYILLSNALGLLAAWAGMGLGRTLSLR